MKSTQVKNTKSNNLKNIWIKTVYKENTKLNAKELADKVTTESGITCNEKDVKRCLWVPDEDYSLESRRHLFSLKQYKNYE